MAVRITQLLTFKWDKNRFQSSYLSTCRDQYLQESSSVNSYRLNTYLFKSRSSRSQLGVLLKQLVRSCQIGREHAWTKEDEMHLLHLPDRLDHGLKRHLHPGSAGSSVEGWE